MEMFEIGVSLVGGAFLAIMGWTIQRASNLGEKVSVLETKQGGLHELIEVKFDEVNRRLDKIEKAMNGHFRGSD
jgi:hypothetical protein